MAADPFDELLGLEERFYQEGEQLGRADGAKAGRVEGRAFGLEKGFERFVQSGKLHGRSLVWGSRLSNKSSSSPEKNGPTIAPNDAAGPVQLPLLPQNARLDKHIRVLYALTEPASLSRENTEEAVSDFDDRHKRAIGKMKIIERLTGEDSGGLNESGHPASSSNQPALADAGIEDVDILKARH
jgi:hypothetical protein